MDDENLAGMDPRLQEMLVRQMQQQRPQMPPAQMQPPQQGPQMLQQRLEQRLNPRIGTLQDSNPEAMAQFMVRSNPQQASSLLTRMLMMMNRSAAPAVPVNPNGFPMGGR